MNKKFGTPKPAKLADLASSFTIEFICIWDRSETNLLASIIDPVKTWIYLEFRFYYFNLLTNSLKASGLLTAKSANTFLLISILFALSLLMNSE